MIKDKNPTGKTNQAEYLCHKIMRTPETYYVKHAYITFRKIKGVVHYYICKFVDRKSITPEGAGDGIIRDEAHKQQFLKCKTLEEMLKIHSLGSVSH